MFFKKRMYTLCVLLLWLPITAFSQFNIKIGYTGGYTQASVMNSIIDQFHYDFNAKYNGTLDELQDRVKILNGLEVGVRYKFSNVGFELNWNSLSDKSDAYGALASGARIQSKWYTSLTQYALGVENYFGNFGYGASIGYRTVRVKTAIEGVQRKKSDVLTESGFTSKFYLLYEIPGEIVSLAIKPYIEVPLKDTNISSFNQRLYNQVDKSYISPQPIYERFMLYGISVILYNGPQ